MATSTGKKARKQGGTKAAIKKASRRSKHAKIMHNNKLTPEQYRSMKLSKRKSLHR